MFWKYHLCGFCTSRSYWTNVKLVLYFVFLTSSANSIVIAIVNIQTGSIDWNVRSLVQLQATQEAFWVLGRCLCISVMRLQINCCPIIATTAVSRVQPCTGCKQTWHTEADRERERGGSGIMDKPAHWQSGDPYSTESVCAYACLCVYTFFFFVFRIQVGRQSVFSRDASI